MSSDSLGDNARSRREVEWIVRPAANPLSDLKKLQIDFAMIFPLRVHREVKMNEDEDGQHRRERISEAFGLLTAKLEDAATIAVEGQGRHSAQQLRRYAQQIDELASETKALAGLLAALIPSGDREPDE
ncbi:hypothetical protein ACOYW6_08360 [Parablastomonas sp. CN1-191]|uniref:hypothetical protein n=1 Tax=Parablastomonas sp. CN1-191 TaxID=3400908 RepID=UPI003BF7D8A5